MRRSSALKKSYKLLKLTINNVECVLLNKQIGYAMLNTVVMGVNTLLFHRDSDEAEVRAKALHMSLCGVACSVWPQELHELAIEWAAGCEAA